jgi:aspartate/methionine/tyrosine aminotransferase
MTFNRTLSRSPYMEYAKLHSPAKYNLATSGMPAYPLADLNVAISDLEINGPDVYGYEPLKQAIATRYRVGVENVVTATGTAMANYLAMAACANPGDEILIEQPTYPLLLDAARYLGLKIRRFRRSADDFQIDLKDLERNLSAPTKLIVLCNMHNPTGVLTSRETLREVGEMAKNVGAKVIVDEVYLEMLWQAKPESAFHLDSQVFISTNSLTKGYGLSGLRCGWVLALADAVERMWHINDVHGSTPVFMAEQVSVMAFRKLGEIAAKQKAVLEENRAILKEFLKGQSAFDYVWPEQGTVLALRIRQGSADEFAQRLREKFEAGVVPGRFFEMPQHVRVGVGIPTDQLRSALPQLSKALNT